MCLVDRGVLHQLHEHRTLGGGRGASSQEEQEPRRVDGEDSQGSEAPPRSQPCPDHDETATPMAALLNWTATQDYAPLHSVAKDEVDRVNKVLAALRKPSLRDQLSPVKTMLHSGTSSLQMEREVGTCVLSFSLLPHCPLNELTTLMCFTLETRGREGVQAH